MRSHGIHLRGLSLDNVKVPINKTRLKIAVLKWHPGLPGTNELTSFLRSSILPTWEPAARAHLRAQRSSRRGLPRGRWPCCSHGWWWHHTEPGGHHTHLARWNGPVGEWKESSLIYIMGHIYWWFSQILWQLQCVTHWSCHSLWHNHWYILAYITSAYQRLTYKTLCFFSSYIIMKADKHSPGAVSRTCALQGQPPGAAAPCHRTPIHPVVRWYGSHPWTVRAAHTGRNPHWNQVQRNITTNENKSIIMINHHFHYHCQQLRWWAEISENIFYFF